MKCQKHKKIEKQQKKSKTIRSLPTLRPVTDENKRYRKLNGTQRQRRMAINEGVRSEAKKTGKTMKKAAIAKKGRFNILRIYRRNNKIKECKLITEDMRDMDEKYGLNKTEDICGKK